MDIAGESGFSIYGAIDDKGAWSLKGRWTGTFSSIIVPGINISLSDLKIDLPVELASLSKDQNMPFPHASLVNDQDILHNEKTGSVHIGRVSWDKRLFEGIDLQFLVSKNRFCITNPVYLNIWGGRIFLNNMEADSIISSEASYHATIGIEGINLEELLEGTAFPVSGKMEGDIPSIRYKNDRLDFEGSLDIHLMGGLVRARGLYIEDPFDKGMKIGGSIYWDGIQLDRLTDRIPIGKISGVIKGKLTDFEMEYGQPSKFLLEVESVKQRGVKQKISVEAINNLSLIGTGSSGVHRVLSSGLNRFFSFYPYSKIGFRCTLKNDIFSLRGLILDGGQEFLIRRTFFRGIDIINQNPDNTISFKDMEKRINRIFGK